MKVIIIIVTRTHGDLNRMTGKSKTSLRRLIDGGAAILMMQKINHHNEMDGKIINIPLQMYRLRDWTFS